MRVGPPGPIAVTANPTAFLTGYGEIVAWALMPAVFALLRTRLVAGSKTRSQECEHCTHARHGSANRKCVRHNRIRNTHSKLDLCEMPTNRSRPQTANAPP